jgi:hypothetical protein
VTAGAEGEGFVEILSGLAPGERVVTSSQFLLDSDSNLREAIQKLTGSGRPRPERGTHGSEGGASAESPPSAHGH